MSPKAQLPGLTLDFETCPFCQSHEIMKLPIYDDGTMYRRHRWSQGVVSYAKAGVKTSEIIKCGNCDQVITLDEYAGEKILRGRKINPHGKIIREKGTKSTSPEQAHQKHQQLKEQKKQKKTRCRHLKTLHADPNALFCHECGKFTIVGKFLQLDNRRRVQVEWWEMKDEEDSE